MKLVTIVMVCIFRTLFLVIMVDIAPSIASIEEIVDQILSNFSILELLPKCLVCKSWQKAVRRIISSRTKVTFLSSNVIETNSAQASVCESSDGEFYSTFQNKYGRRVKRIKYESNNFAPEHRQMIDNFLKWRASWITTPQIVFVIHKLNNDTDKVCIQNFKQLNETLVRYLPATCVLVMLKGAMYNPGNEFVTCLRNETLFFSSAVGSSVDVLAWQSLTTVDERKELKDTLERFLVNHRDLKFLFFYYRATSQNHISHWVRLELCPLLHTHVIQGGGVVVGCAVEGGIQHSNTCSNAFVKLSGARLSGSKCGKPDRHTQKCGSFLAIAVSGKSVSTSSVILNHNINTVSELNKKIKLLKESVLPKGRFEMSRNNCFGLMVSCIGRMHDFEWYDDYGGRDYGAIERLTFERAFPKVPLLVTHGFGEVGGDCNVSTPSEVTPANMCNYHSTIFAVVVM